MVPRSESDSDDSSPPARPRFRFTLPLLFGVTALAAAICAVLNVFVRADRLLLADTPQENLYLPLAVGLVLAIPFLLMFAAVAWASFRRHLPKRRKASPKSKTDDGWPE